MIEMEESEADSDIESKIQQHQQNIKWGNVELEKEQSKCFYSPDFFVHVAENLEGLDVILLSERVLAWRKSEYRKRHNKCWLSWSMITFFVDSIHYTAGRKSDEPKHAVACLRTRELKFFWLQRRKFWASDCSSVLRWKYLLLRWPDDPEAPAI